jgi:hypothetical protein
MYDVYVFHKSSITYAGCVGSRFFSLRPRLPFSRRLHLRFELDRIRPPKREQIQFLFPSLGLHRIVGCVLRGSVDPTRAEEGADSSNMTCIFKTTFLFILRAAAAQQPRLGNKN